MKKFLSVLLALAVAFTFTFGSTMSAFAADGDYSGSWNKVVGTAEVKAEAALEAYEVNYDKNVATYKETYGYAGQTDAYGDPAIDPTVFEISVANLKAALQEGLYKDVLANPSLIGNLTQDEDADIELVKNYFLENIGHDIDEAAKLSWADYKTMLHGIVNSINLDGYTKTTGTTYYVDGTPYTTSAKAAAAMVEYMNDIIDAATYTSINSYYSLYDALADSYLATVDTYNDVEVKNYVKAVTYVLAAADDEGEPLATATTESIDKEKLEAAQLTEKAKLNQAIVNWKTDNTKYNSKQDEAIAAYKEAMTYLIENSEKPSDADLNRDSYKITDITKSAQAPYNYEVNGEDYIQYCANAADWVKEYNQNKAYFEEVGYIYDADAYADALKDILLDVYSDGTSNKKLDTDIAALTNAFKTYVKIDVSDIVAVPYDLATMEDATEYNELAYYFAGWGAYYEKEWTSVKVAVDAYNTAVDAATTITALRDAFSDFEKAMAKIVEADDVDSSVAGYYKEDASTTDLESTVANYYNAVLSNSGETQIFITWDGETYTGSLDDADVITWAINKGARTKAEVKALYSDAKAVIDAYKTLSAIKSDAAAVVEMIKVLPQKAKDVTLADKDAIAAAKAAYNCLPEEGTVYVASVIDILNNDLTAVEKLDAAAVKSLFDAIPSNTAITVDDKAAVEAAQAAFDAYNKLAADGVYEGDKLASTVTQDFLDEKVAAIERKELTAIKDAYAALEARYDTTGITAADAEAVKALQAAIDEFVANYPKDADDVSWYEFQAQKMAAELDREDQVVNKYDNQDAKADLLDMSRKLTIWRTSKTSIKVTAVGSVKNIKANGYTVKYSFYKKAAGSKTYKLVKSNSTSSKYTYKNLKKGWNYFQVKVKVYDPEGKLVATKMTYYRAAKIK